MTTDTAARMLAQGVTDEVSLVPLGNGTYRTRSAKTPFGVTYTTTATSCNCPAGQHHGYCKHMAHVRDAETAAAPDLTPVIATMLAELEARIPTTEPESDTCAFCDGNGRRDYQDEVRPGVWRWTSEPCNVCHPDGNYMGWWR